MSEVNLATLARRVADVLEWSGRNTALCLHLLRLLARGQPVTLAPLADMMQRSLEEIARQLQEMPDIEYDELGRIVGSGLSLLPTPHRFTINGKTLYTWCPLDALSYPLLLKQPACVESPCPVTGNAGRLTVTPPGIEDLEPAGAVVSLVVPAREVCS